MTCRFLNVFKDKLIIIGFKEAEVAADYGDEVKADEQKSQLKKVSSATFYNFIEVIKIRILRHNYCYNTLQ